jgi:hypothetical protein
VTLAYDIDGLPRRMGRIANRWTLRPAGTGTGTGTAVTVTSTVDIGVNPLARGAEWIVCRVMARQSDSMLAGLARHLKRSHGS